MGTTAQKLNYALSAKNAIKTVLEGKGVTVPEDFAQYGIAVNQLLNTSDATATAGDVLSGKTAYINGGKVTGTYDKLKKFVGNQSVSLTSDDLSGVTRITSGAFSGNTSLTSIVIPSTVTRIEDGAFAGCTSLQSVTFQENSQLKWVGSGVFDGCTSLTFTQSGYGKYLGSVNNPYLLLVYSENSSLIPQAGNQVIAYDVELDFSFYVEDRTSTAGGAAPDTGKYFFDIKDAFSMTNVAGGKFYIKQLKNVTKDFSSGAISLKQGRTGDTEIIYDLNGYSLTQTGNGATYNGDPVNDRTEIFYDLSRAKITVKNGSITCNGLLHIRQDDGSGNDARAILEDLNVELNGGALVHYLYANASNNTHVTITRSVIKSLSNVDYYSMFRWRAGGSTRTMNIAIQDHSVLFVNRPVGSSYHGAIFAYVGGTNANVTANISVDGTSSLVGAWGAASANNAALISGHGNFICNLTLASGASIALVPSANIGITNFYLNDNSKISVYIGNDGASWHVSNVAVTNGVVFPQIKEVPSYYTWLIYGITSGNAGEVIASEFVEDGVAYYANLNPGFADQANFTSDIGLALAGYNFRVVNDADGEHGEYYTDISTAFARTDMTDMSFYIKQLNDVTKDFCSSPISLHGYRSSSTEIVYDLGGHSLTQTGNTFATGNDNTEIFYQLLQAKLTIKNGTITCRGLLHIQNNGNATLEDMNITVTDGSLVHYLWADAGVHSYVTIKRSTIMSSSSYNKAAMFRWRAGGNTRTMNIAIQDHSTLIVNRPVDTNYGGSMFAFSGDSNSGVATVNVSVDGTSSLIGAWGTANTDGAALIRGYSNFNFNLSLSSGATIELLPSANIGKTKLYVNDSNRINIIENGAIWKVNTLSLRNGLMLPKIYNQDSIKWFIAGKDYEANTTIIATNLPADATENQKYDAVWDMAGYSQGLTAQEGNSVYWVSKGSCTDSYIKIPPEIEGHQIHGINRLGFASSSARIIALSEGIKNIQDSAFYNCQNLQIVYLPSTINFIAGENFISCPNLKAIYLLAKDPPQLESSETLSGSSCPIYIPHGCRNAYLDSTNFSSAADRIFEL